MGDIKTAVHLLSSSSKTVILTGAGMSTESGIPDFRSSSGWWKNIDPTTVATVEAIEQNYDVFHEFYSARITSLEQCEPHDGHFILANWERKGLVTLISTQNVDGFHSKAGNQEVEELHGSIHLFKCHHCKKRATKNAFLHKEACVNCGGKLRPEVVLFGENLPEKSWIRSLNTIREAELVIVIGTSLEVYPVNQLPTMTKGKTVIINKELPTSTTYFDLTLQGSAKELLTQIDKSL